MVRTIFTFMMAGLLVLMIGCSDENETTTVNDPAPQPPQGVYTVTGDDSVFVYWNGPYERDIKEFIVWRSFEEFDNYLEIGRRTAKNNPNLDLIYYEPGFIDTQVDNGTTYFYAVSSVDKRGQVSELSAETVFDTPRPDGTATLYDVAVNQSLSAFDFSEHQVLDAGESIADVFVDRVEGVFYINIANDFVDLQSMGFHDWFEDIGWAPVEGWSNNGWAEVVLGHIYVVRITDAADHVNYAKLQVTSINSSVGTVTFRWAYQEADDNRELVPENGDDTMIQLETKAGL
ncbi:MAG: hypothetical protein ABIE70_06725 [bacterium]